MNTFRQENYLVRFRKNIVTHSITSLSYRFQTHLSYLSNGYIYIYIYIYTYGPFRNYVDKFQQLAVDFWCLTGHDQPSPQSKCCPCLTRQPIPTFSSYRLPHFTSSFLLLIIATVTSGRRQTRNVNMGCKKLLSYLTYGNFWQY